MKKKLIFAFVELVVLLYTARILQWRGLKRRAIAAFSSRLKQILGVEFWAENIHIQCSVLGLLKKKIRFRVIIENAEIRNFPVDNEKVQFTYLECDLYGSFNRNCIVIHDTSTLTYNFLICNIAFTYIIKERALQGKVIGEHLTALNLLRSFPDFSCRDIYAMRYSGYLSFKISGGYCAGNMAKTYLNAVFEPENLIIYNRSNTVFNRLNSSYIHAVYQDGDLIKSIELSENNADFIEFNKIPERLYKIILHTEDPNFFLHKGVDRSFLDYALLQNVQGRRVIRGGSTITMQLVRNLYLGHKRSIYRKVEEIVIAWLLEVVFLIPKTRILEVYLNIIEFAPGIYGIKEACRYYFDKLPAELSVTECLVLSYIIPRPKHFDEALSCSSEQLRTNLKKHIDTVSKNLFACGTITHEQLTAINFVFRVRDKLLCLIDTAGQPLTEKRST